MTKNRQPFVLLSDGMAEAVYKAEEKETHFAIYRDDRSITYEKSVKVHGGEILPPDPKSDVVSKGVVLFPVRAEEYGSDDELRREVQEFIHAYVDISPQFEQIATDYVFLTWMFDRFDELPYLRVRGDYGSGKSRFLFTAGSICYRPILTGGATTPSPIFRILDGMRGTLLLDEADFRFSDEKADIVKILNIGYQKGAVVLRSEGRGTFEVKAYNPYGPKIVATRQNFNDQALESRFLVEDMGREKLREDIPVRLNDRFRENALVLRNKLLMWRFHNYRKELVFDDTPIPDIHPRLRQIIMPLLALTKDEKMREVLIEQARAYGSELAANRGLTWEYDIILAVLRLSRREQRGVFTIREITDEANRGMEFEDDRLKPRKVGWLLRTRLQLKLEGRGRGGYSLSISRNQERLDFWKERLSITDMVIEDSTVNDVHVMNDTSSDYIRPEDIPF